MKDKLNGCIFWLKIYFRTFFTYQNNMLIFGDKVSADMVKELGIESVYNKELLKTKIKSYGDEVTDFYDKNIS